VGRDKNTSNFFDKLEKSVQNIVAGHTAIRQRRTFSFRWVSTDPVFVGRLKSLPRQGSDNWTQTWIETCTKNTECRGHIREEIQKCRSEGWEPVFIGFDNHGDGIHVNLECEKEFSV
ncbi:MAG TPA: hypothetical protein VJ440_04505, partial [Candidatus Brocadiaceae bacterium]|nr:hypothetical protein [Candidatus Brocadiaceae bacterium]